MSSSAGNPMTTVVTDYPKTAVASRSNGDPPPRPFYPPPPPAYAPPPPEYAPLPRYSTTFTNVVYLLVLAFAVIIVLVCLAIAIIIPVLGPRMPEFAVSSACVTGFNVSSAQQQQQLSASFDLNLTVHSPNRLMRIYYEQVTASVLYASDILSENPLAPFDQGKGETTVLRVRLAALGEYVNSDVVRGIESDRGRGDGAVGFNVRIFSWVIFRSGSRTTSWSILSVHCDDVLFGFGNGTATTGYLLGSAPKKCMVISENE